ncbi:MAG: hypothetical protein B7Y57_29910 [Rhodospirillales bacterium 35-66-84]|nr:MAG: hypothetical protein B7Y57_29910 [Rhodospirillales bacterium 35-66-84]OZB20787.1 MAG: hypothetical protein B7X63_29915 [Rhodospirillales bacterium 39-66-50]
MRMDPPRRWFTTGAAALAYLTAFGVAYAQPSFADIAGAWAGSTTNDVKLDLFISADGRYVLRFLTGPGGGSIPRGLAAWNGDVVVLKYGDTEISLTKSTDGKLVGPYESPRGKGSITFIRK